MRQIGAPTVPKKAPIKSLRIEATGSAFVAKEYEFITTVPIAQVISHRMEISGQGQLQNLNSNHTISTEYPPYIWTLGDDITPDPDLIYTLEILYTE